MMNRYKVPTLTPNTPKTHKNKLMTALKQVSGVQSATLHPAAHEFQIEADTKHAPKRDEIASAARKAGFELEAATK